MNNQKPTPNLRGSIVSVLALLIAFFLPIALARFSDGRSGQGDWAGRDNFAGELSSYLWGGALAFILTAVAIGLVYWSVLPHGWLMSVVGVLAVIQIVVHFRFFLHIDPPHQNTHDLLLILFTTLILFTIVGGTMSILGDLAGRMH